MSRFTHIAIVASSTMGSRVLGLLRDVLLFAAFGAGWVNSAFIFAFTLPNLFRRLFGEGALSSAVIPVLSTEVIANDKRRGFQYMNGLLSRLTFALLVIVLIAVLFLLALSQFPGLEERWQLSGYLGALMMPYLILICLAAMFAAALNVLGNFAIPALTAIWLNLAMITALLLGMSLFPQDPIARAYILCVGVLIGGLAQCLTTAAANYKQGWRPKVDFHPSPALKETWDLFLPGLVGAGIFQLNLVVSRLLAFSVNEWGVAILYQTNRLIELPLGVFTIAITTVFFPRLSKEAAESDIKSFSKTYAEGLSLILAITIPASIGLIILREPILRLLFEWGAYTETDLYRATPILLIYALGLPFYSLATFATRGFHALKDTRTPVRLAAVAFISNLILALPGIYFAGISGLAIAGIASAIIQSLYLQYKLSKHTASLQLYKAKATFLKITCAGVVMGAFTYGCWLWLLSFNFQAKSAALLGVTVIIPFSILAYIAALWLLRIEGRQHALKWLCARFR